MNILDIDWSIEGFIPELSINGTHSELKSVSFMLILFIGLFVIKAY